MRESLHRLFRPPEGYALLRGLGMTYSVNQRTLETARDCLCGRDLGRLIAFERGELFRLYFQQGEYVPRSAAAPAPNCLVPVSLERGSLHAKLYVLRFGRAEEEVFRIVAASANLTNTDELNVYASFDSTEEGTAELGRDAAALFRRIPEAEAEAGTFLEDLERAKFAGGARLLLPAGREFRALFQADLARRPSLTLISPFLSASALAKLRPAHLVSRQEALDGLEEAPDCPCSVLDPAREDLPRALHAKAYLLQGAGEPGTVLYLGSANATVSAFRENLEALVRLETGVDPEGLLENFRPWTPSREAPDPEAREREAFEKLCREAVRSFRAEEDSYQVRRERCGALTPLLNGAPPESEEWRWPRRRRESHVVPLTLRDARGHEMTAPLFVRGRPVPCDEGALCLEALAGCFQASPPGERSRRKSGKSQSPCKEVPVKEKELTLAQWVLQIRDLDTARRVLALAGTAPREASENGAFWEAVRRGILAAYPELAEGGGDHGGD